MNTESLNINTEQIRSFIAIELPPEVRQALSRFQEKLKAGGRNVKWVAPGNMHLTLQFLGNIDAKSTDRIISAIEQGAGGVHPFRIDISGTGVFPDSRRVRVVWVGLAGELENLSRLQKNIGEKLAPLGFPPENRPFTPHLTLGRVRDDCRPEERASLGQLIERTAFSGKYTVDVKSVNLMKSQLTREGPIYTRLGSITLK